MDQTHEYHLKLAGSCLQLRMDAPETIKNKWDGQGHNHAEYELHILLEGACRVDVEGKNYLLSAGHAIIIAPGRYHCPMPDLGPFERFSVYFSVEEPLLSALTREVPVCRVYPFTEEVISVCRDIFFEFSGPQLFGKDMLRSQLLRFLVCNFRLLNLPIAAEWSGSRSPILGEGDYNDLIDTFFEKHLKEMPTADELATKLFVSRRQLSRILQKNYGMSFREKLLRTRLNRAAWLLRHTDLAIGQVAAEVGYTVPASFFHVFRDNYGMTPEQYKAAQKNSPGTGESL